MAKKSLLPFVVNGYAQVEANRLTAMVNGEMESQAPAFDKNTGAGIPVVENGMFLCIRRNNNAMFPFGRTAVVPGQADATDALYMSYSERKVYDERETAIDFAGKSESSIDGLFYPRLFKMTVGDVFTTNCINEAAGSLVVGDILYVGDDGYLSKTTGQNKTICFVVSKVYTMPDGQPGVMLYAENYK